MTRTITTRSAATIGALAAFSMPMASAQDTQTEEPKLLAPVEVVGTRMKRTDWETPAPVQVITAEDIRNSGATSTYDVLANIGAAGIGAVEDLTIGSGGFSSGSATVSLRGLGSSSTLVLLNGRRIAPSPFNDPAAGQSVIYNLNVIPPAAIERIEVLKSGASAIYGSDAVGGVVNIILRPNYRGAEAGLTYGINEDGQFGNRQFHGLVGFGDTRADGQPGFNGYLLFGHAKRDRGTVPKTRGVEEGELTRIFNRNSAAASTASYPPNYFTESTPGSGVFDEFLARDARCPAELARPSGRCGSNREQYLDTVAPQETTSILGRLNVPLRGGMSMFSEFGFARVESNHVVGPRTAIESGTFWFARDGRRNSFLFTLPPGHPDNPASVPVALRYRFVDVGPSSFGQTTDTARLLLGVKGEAAGWDWESALLHNRIDLRWRTRGFLYLPALLDAIGSQAYRPFGDNSPQTIAAISPTIAESGASSITVWDLKGTRKLTELAGGPLALAAGMEARHEKLKVSPDARVVNGDFVDLGSSEANGSRRVGSLYAELSAPFMKRVESQLAVRFDHYSDFGNSTTPQLGVKWKPTDALALRASYARGFRAPSLSQIGNSSIQQFDIGLSDPLRCLPPGNIQEDCDLSVPQLLRSNPDLQPEKSTSQTVGLVFAPTRNVDFAIDFYRIDRRNEVGTYNTQFIIDNEASFPGAVIRNPNPASWVPGVPNSGPIQSSILQYFNLGRTITSGVDVEANLRNSLGAWGSLRTQFSGTYLHKYKSRFTSADPYIEAQGGFGPFGALPRFKGSVSTTWTYQSYALTGRINHVAGWRFGDSANDCFETNALYLESYDCRVRSWTTVDLLMRYMGVKNLELGIAVRNLQDKPAPLDPNYTSIGYNPNFHNPYGRNFLVWLNYKFM